MRSQRVAVVLSVVNLVLLVFLLAQVQERSSAQTSVVTQTNVAPVLRARAFEMVGDDGKVRAQLNIESTGEAVFRLRDSKGTIRTKIGAGEDGSGLSMMDERTEATVQIHANQTGSGITLFTRDGKQHELK